MKVRGVLSVILVAVCAQIVPAQQMPDTLWLYKDVIVDTEKYWYDIGLCDTFVINTDCFYPTDTGDKYDGNYINFDYQFKDGEKPGYAGFKIFWDMGMVTFNVTEYDSMVFMHKGPLAGHKVHMIWSKGEGCGGPITRMDFGDFSSSAVWKREAIAFPAGFITRGIFELRLLIQNESGTSPTSAPGCLKIDNLGFVRKGSAVSNPKRAPLASGTNRYFVPTASGKVTLAVYSLQGEQLFKGLVDVAAGKKYDVGTFAQQNSNLPARWINCVQITGSGVNITGKVCR